MILGLISCVSSRSDLDHQMADLNTKILIVDDEPFIRAVLSEALKTWNYLPIEADSVAAALRQFEEHEPAVALLDIDLPDGSGLDVLKTIKELRPQTIAIMITGNVSVENSISAMRSGAHDFIGKPIRLEELQITLRNAIETLTLRREVERTRRQQSGFDISQIIGESPAMVNAKELALKVAGSDISSVLLQGETGTGKDLFAKAIHYESDRAKAPYLAINCAALPATLIESELFGYEKGAFTDAKQRKEGLFEQAQGGTIFLDEIGEMELPLQAKLLRVLENNTFRRVGGLKDIDLDVRIVAASNQDLKRAGENGTFRSDLYYRLSVIQIDIPPLKVRGGDVLLLAKHYINIANQKRRTVKLESLSAEAEQVFFRYDWPGNVRELRNVIERSAVLEDGSIITTKHLPVDILLSSAEKFESLIPDAIILPQSGVSLEKVESELARQAMVRTNGNLTQAAKLLDITRDQLRYKLRKAGLYEHEKEK